MKAALFAVALAACHHGGSPGDQALVFRTPDLRWEVGEDARSVSFVVHGADVLDRREDLAIASVVVGGSAHRARSARAVAGGVELSFAGTDTVVRLAIETRGRALAVEVAGARGGRFDELQFLHLHVAASDHVAASTIALTLTAHVDEIPLQMRSLDASCLSRLGCAGARVAVIAAPEGQLRAIAKDVLASDLGLPHTVMGGPWAADVAMNHESYLFDFGTLSMANAAEWVAAARRIGASAIEHHGGSSFRFGDLTLDPKRWPGGWQEFGALVARLHHDHIGSILHTYAFFIDPHSSYVTPVPDPRLDASRTFALPAALSPEARTLTIDAPAGTVLEIGQELVRVVRQDGQEMTVERGAFETRSAAHEAGATVRVLKMRFGMFVPDVASSLFLEIARRHAQVLDSAGFDGVYLDALDGSAVLRGTDEAWYWSAQFIAEIQAHVHHPVTFDMSGMTHHYWRFRSRTPAWDAPSRGYKRYLDEQVRAAAFAVGLPVQLGWWGFHQYAPPETERTFDDDVAYLAVKLLAYGAGTGVVEGASDPEAATLGTLLAKRLSDRARAVLRTPGIDIDIDQSGSIHRATRGAQLSGVPWVLTNPFAAQAPKLRIEALSGIADAGGLELLRPGNVQAAYGVTLRLAGRELTAYRANPRTSGRWAWLQVTEDPPLNLTGHEALRLRVRGDGRGELLAIRLESASGAVLDRYERIDFTGWRDVSLLEAESERWSDAVWEDGHSLANVYRDAVDLHAVTRVSFGLADLPQGESRVALEAVKAVPMVDVPVEQPTVFVGAHQVTFPVTLTTGQYLEFDGHGDAVVHGRDGAVVSRVVPAGAIEARPGANAVRLATSGAARAKVTLVLTGDVIE